MEIKIDEKLMQQVMDEQTSKAMQSAFSDWEISRKIKETIIESVMPELLVRSVTEAASRIDVSSLTQAIADEMSRALVRSISHVVKETMINVIIKIKGIESYDTEKIKKEREKLSTLI